MTGLLWRNLLIVALEILYLFIRVYVVSDDLLRVTQKGEYEIIIEKIQGRPRFEGYVKEGIDLPDFEAEELKKVSAGASVLLGGLGGATAGVAGGFAAAGATTSAVMALGTASTGTAISSLTGVAAANATLAALGGGSIAAGGGGVALGTAVLGGATLGVGLLVGGIIFNVTGSKLSDQADEAYSQAVRTENEVYKIVGYFDELVSAVKPFQASLTEVENQYKKRLSTLDHIINFSEKRQWDEFTEKEKKMTENTVLLVGLLYKMCKTSLVLKDKDGDGLNTVNKYGTNIVIREANEVLDKVKEEAYKILVCPECSQKARIPIGKGNVVIRCPRCRIEFYGKS